MESGGSTDLNTSSNDSDSDISVDDCIINGTVSSDSAAGWEIDLQPPKTVINVKVEDPPVDFSCSPARGNRNKNNKDNCSSAKGSRKGNNKDNCSSTQGNGRMNNKNYAQDKKKQQAGNVHQSQNKHNNSQKKNTNKNHQNNTTKDEAGQKAKDRTNNWENAKKGEERNMFTEVKSILSSFTKRGEKHGEIIDNFVLRLHYSLGVCFFLIAFLLVQGNWFVNESIHCVFGNNADKTVPPAHLNTCLSYPYTCKPSQLTVYNGEDCPPRYVIFYRWIHFSFLLVAGLYYTPRLLAKRAGYTPLKKLITDLEAMEERYDDFAFKDGVAKMVHYFENHYFVHSSLYTRLIMCHVLALTVDIASFFYFDFFIQNFLGLMYRSFPFHRNPVNFSDNLYQTFPPFVFCSIDEYNLINNARKDLLHCHLLLMELYEKVFVLLWVWLAFLSVLAATSLAFLVLFSLPFFNRVFLFTFTTSKTIKKIKREVLGTFGYGDLYVMYLTKCYVSEGQFLLFLAQILEKYKKSLDGLINSDKHEQIAEDSMIGNHYDSTLRVPRFGWVTANPGAEPAADQTFDSFLNLPRNAVMPDIYSQGSSSSQGHRSSTPKCATEWQPPFIQSRKQTSLYPIHEKLP